jgi:proliferating cell nuclear antigen
MGKIIEIQTEHVLSIKLLFEVLKEILNDVTIEVIRDDVMNKLSESTNYDNEQIFNEELNDLDDDIEEENKKSKKKKKDKKKDKIDNQFHQRKEDDDSKCGGLKIMTVDPSKTLLIQMKLDSKQFSVFKCKPANYDICISLVQLYKLLKSLDKDDTLAICIDDDDEQHVVLKVDNQEKKCETTYRLKLMDLDKKVYKIPPIAFDAVITLDATEFHKICREMHNIAEFVEIKVTPNSITYSCKGDTSDRSTTYYPGENGIKIKFSNNKNSIIQGIFELKYLVLFTKCANLCSDIQIFIKNSYPLCIKYTVATLGKILLCLAPVDETHTKGSFSDDDDVYDDDDTKLKLKNV